MRAILHPLVLATAMLTAGCAGSGPPPQSGSDVRRDDLTNIRWKLTRLQGETVPILDREIWLVLEAGSGVVRGFAGCNGFRGAWVITDSLLAVSGIITTMKACPELPRESGFLKALETETTYAVRRDTLILRLRGVEIARFEAVHLN